MFEVTDGVQRKKRKRVHTRHVDHRVFDYAASAAQAILSPPDSRTLSVVEERQESIMVKKPKQAPNAANIKEKLEESVGHTIGVLAFPAGFSEIWYGVIKWKNVLPFPSEYCTTQADIDVSGTSSTLADGKRVFLLTDFVCSQVIERFGFGFVEPINVVATPRAARPVFLTMARSSIPDPQARPNVQITVFAWDANGVPAPNVEFDWRCRAALIQVGGPVVSPG
jgi:hypothetical protein